MIDMYIKVTTSNIKIHIKVTITTINVYRKILTNVVSTTEARFVVTIVSVQCGRRILSKTLREILCFAVMVSYRKPSFDKCECIMATSSK